MKFQSKLFLSLGIGLILCFMVFCISDVRSHDLTHKKNSDIIRIQQKEIKNKLNNIHKKLKERLTHGH